MEEEFIRNQELLKPREEQNEVILLDSFAFMLFYPIQCQQSERAKVDDIRGTPMSVGNLEEMIDENHAIVSSSMGPEYYVSVMSFVNKDNLEPGSSVLLHNKVRMFHGWTFKRFTVNCFAGAVCCRNPPR